MICYGNYFKVSATNEETGMNEVDVQKEFGQGRVEQLGARYQDRYVILGEE